MISEREGGPAPDEPETKELPPEDIEELERQAAEIAARREEAEGAEPETAETKVDEEEETEEESAAGWKDRYLRALAEQENLQKRVERERGQVRRYAEEALIRDLLPLLDSVRLAAGAEGGADAIREGVELAHQGLLRLLAERGLEPIEAIDQPFDPRLHEAIATIPDPDHAPGTVIEEISKGYTLQGRVLRASKVHVAVAPPEDGGEEDSDGSDTGAETS